MEVRRRIRKNKIINDIREANIFITRSNATIKRLKSSNMGEIYVTKQLEILKNAVTAKSILLENFETDLLNVTSGGLDDHINQGYTDRHLQMSKDQEERDHIKDIKKSDKKNNYYNQKYCKVIWYINY